MLAVSLTLFAYGCVEQEPDRPTAADWKTIKQNILKKAPAKLTHKVDADFEGKVVYLGMDVDKNPVRPGQQFTITHYWQVKQAVPGWKVFVHLHDPKHQGKYFINADHKPVQGRYPAAMWKVGEIIRDRHQVTLRRNWDAPEVNVYVGLWKGRMRLKPKGKHDGQHRLLAGTLKVAVRPSANRKKPLKQLVAVKSEKPLTIDGKLDEPVWQKARTSGAFVNTLTGAPMPVKTEVKVAWDDKFIYFGFQNVDTDVWSAFKKRDDKLWTQEAVEIFIDANGDGKDYIELQVNPHGAIFDSYLPAHRKNDNAWNSKLQAAVVVDGTVDKRDDKDKGWTVEIALPWEDAKGKGSYELKPPTVGSTWRVNFFRMDLPQKKPQVASGWSPPLVGDFHKLDRFGKLVFGDDKGKVPMATRFRGVPMKGGRILPMAGGRARTVPSVRHMKRRMMPPGARAKMPMKAIPAAVAKKPVPVKKPVAKKPVPVKKPVAKKPVAKAPVAKAPVAKAPVAPATK